MIAPTWCARCAGPMKLAVPAGDNRERHLCERCGAIHYENPRVVVGALVEHGDEVLLCRRAIEPRRGLWTVPAGFLELGEEASAGALRETLEETGVLARIEAPLVHFDLPAIGQIYLVFRATALDLSGLGNTDTQSESLAVQHFSWDALPWDELAFDAIRYTLQLRLGDRRDGVDRLHYGAIRRPADATSPWGTQRLEGHVALTLAR